MNKLEAMSKLRNEEQMYAVMSMCTHMPYVYCEPETYDDVVFLYFSKEDAQEGCRWLLEDKNPIQLAEVKKESRLSFFTSLYPMGINALMVYVSSNEKIIIQLDELIRRQGEGKTTEEQVRIENPSLHLTALYYAQLLRKGHEKYAPMPKELKELDEELSVHFLEGTYIMAVEEGKGVPILQKEGKSFQPLFTDVQEFQKFNREKRFSARMVEAKNIANVLTPGVESVALNPLSANIVLRIGKKKAPENQ